ncbi:MAG: DUF1802 family protein [Cyanobacteria bacterium J06649_4]
MLISTALKEWSVAVDALSAGETIMLLRKGGIKEERGRFLPQSETVVLFPTFEHQKPGLLKPKYQAAVDPVTPGWHPENIKLKAWAKITDVFLTHEAERVEALANFHIWQPQLAQERLKWKAKQPLYVLLLRAYRFPAPIEIPWRSEYGGCRSWIELAQAVDVAAANPVMDESAYLAQVDAIAHCLKS